jgi:hypothetical protein
MIAVCFNTSQDFLRGTPGNNQENGTAVMVSKPADVGLFLRNTHSEH